MTNTAQETCLASLEPRGRPNPGQDAPGYDGSVKTALILQSAGDGVATIVVVGTGAQVITLTEGQRITITAHARAPTLSHEVS